MQKKTQYRLSNTGRDVQLLANPWSNWNDWSKPQKMNYVQRSATGRPKQPKVVNYNVTYKDLNPKIGHNTTWLNQNYQAYQPGCIQSDLANALNGIEQPTLPTLPKTAISRNKTNKNRPYQAQDAEQRAMDIQRGLHQRETLLEQQQRDLKANEAELESARFELERQKEEEQRLAAQLIRNSRNLEEDTKLLKMAEAELERQTQSARHDLEEREKSYQPGHIQSDLVGLYNALAKKTHDDRTQLGGSQAMDKWTKSTLSRQRMDKIVESILSQQNTPKNTMISTSDQHQTQLTMHRDKLCEMERVMQNAQKEMQRARRGIHEALSKQPKKPAGDASYSLVKPHWSAKCTPERTSTIEAVATDELERCYPMKAIETANELPSIKDMKHINPRELERHKDEEIGRLRTESFRLKELVEGYRTENKKLKWILLKNPKILMEVRERKKSEMEDYQRQLRNNEMKIYNLKNKKKGKAKGQKARTVGSPASKIFIEHQTQIDMHREELCEMERVMQNAQKEMQRGPGTLWTKL